MSIEITIPAAQSVTVSSKGPKGDTGAASTVVGPTGPAGSSGTTFTAGTGLTLTGGNLNVDASQSGIDHDSLNNFVAAEHVNWAAASAGTIHASNYTDTTTNTQLSQAQVEDFAGGLFTGNTETGITATYQTDDNTVDLVVGTLNQDTTGNADTATALAAAVAINGVNFDGSGAITVTAAGSTLSDTVTVAKGGTGLTTVAANNILTGNGSGALTPEPNLQFTSNRLTVGANSDLTPSVRVINDENTLSMGVASSGDDLISGSVDGDVVLNSLGDHNILIGQNNAVAAKIDTNGVFVSKTLHVLSANFFDDLSTVKHYLPISSQSLSEITSDGNSGVDYIAPCNFRVLSVQVKFTSLNGNGDLTIGVESSDIAGNPTSKSVVETEVVSVTGNDDNKVIHFLFDNAAVTAGQNMSLSIQASADVTGSSNVFVSVVLEMDWATRFTQASAVIAS